MVNPYRELFRAPGALAFSLAGLIARFPISMISLAIVTMISASRNNYTLSSLVTTTYIAANAIIAPQLSRLADKYGQTRVAIPASIFAALAFTTLIISGHFNWPDWTLFAAAICAGTMPSFGSFTRARWSKLYRGNPLLRSALAFESLADEMIFMIGPILVLQLSINLFPEAGLVAIIVLLAGGALLFCMQKSTEPDPVKIRTSSGKPAIFDRPVLILALTLFALGGIFGVIEISTLAFTRKNGIPGMAFYPLTAYAVGSFITGITYGMLRLRMSLTHQLLIMASMTAITTLPFLFVSDISMLVLISFIAGAACSPTIIICMGLLEILADKEKFTESMTWAITGMSIGAAAGISITGWVVDHYDAQTGFYLTVAFGFFSLLIVSLARRSLAQKTPFHIIKQDDP